MIKFNKPPVLGKEMEYISQVIHDENTYEKSFVQKCNIWIEENFKCKRALLTSSGTHALELAALIIGVKEGDEIIMPSFTFPSCANAFILRGAKIVFVDIRPDTMNIDEKLIEDAITNKTKAIVPVHYAGVACNMDVIMDIAKRHNLYVIEDAAQGVMSQYKGKALGTIGHIGCFSFHETKNYVMGEGGAILINDESFIEKAEIIMEKGTNRWSFLRGEIEEYSWVKLGSSYVPAEVNAAYLYAQLEEAHKINNDRIASWNLYDELLKPLEESGQLQLPVIPKDCSHNAHMYYIKCKDNATRGELIAYLKDRQINTAFHYIPLHSSKAGQKYTHMHGDDKNTTDISKRLLRLPMYFELGEDNIKLVCGQIKNFYSQREKNADV